MKAIRGRIASPALVRQRARRLLYSRKYAGEALQSVLRSLEPVGPIAVFGGMLRNLAFAPPASFASDIDLVVAARNPADLGEALNTFGALRNRYGGYRLNLVGWSLDIWSLYDTWAFRRGFVLRPSFEQLTRTTFFNWDSIVLNLESEELFVSEDYFEALQHRFLEIVLEPNANPSGNVARALNHLVYLRASFGPKLTRYVANFLKAIPAHVGATEYHLFSSPAVADIGRQLAQHIAISSTQPFVLRRRISA